MRQVREPFSGAGVSNVVLPIASRAGASAFHLLKIHGGGMTLLDIALAALLWANVSTMITIWLCPRLFRFLPGDDE